VLDRSELILDISPRTPAPARAGCKWNWRSWSTPIPRLSHMWSHLERLAGGASTAAASVGGIGTRGPGEKQLEIDRRLVQKRVSALKRQLEEIEPTQDARGPQPQGRLRRLPGGYTNAGKST